jgi:hypothetical protein
MPHLMWHPADRCAKRTVQNIIKCRPVCNEDAIAVGLYHKK